MDSVLDSVYTGSGADSFVIQYINTLSIAAVLLGLAFRMNRKIDEANEISEVLEITDSLWAPRLRHAEEHLNARWLKVGRQSRNLPAH